MSILRGLTALGFAFLLALAPAPIPRALAKSVKDILAEVKRNPMKFYVAKGKPGACGPGCSDWIAAEGNVDPDAHDRFKLFLVSLPNTRLPVFINSKGGAGPVARKIGDMLREHGMAAAVGRTISVSRGSRHNLVFHGAKCASSCVYILIGAVRRDVAPQARFGVHAWQNVGKKLSREEIDLRNDALRYYAISKGVDARLIDLSLKTPSKTMHWLSRGELERFGITAEGTFETSWRLLKDRRGHWVVKSSTRAANEGRQTTLIRIGCQEAGNVKIMVVRDLVGREIDGRSSLSVQSESGRLLWHSGPWLNQRRALAIDSIPLERLPDTRETRALVLVERFIGRDDQIWTRETRFSTDGMREAATSMLKSCGNAVPEQSSSPSTPQLTPVKAR